MHYNYVRKEIWIKHCKLYALMCIFGLFEVGLSIIVCFSSVFLYRLGQKIMDFALLARMGREVAFLA